MIHIVAEFLLNLSRSDQGNHLLVSSEDLGPGVEVADNFLPRLIGEAREANIFPPGLSEIMSLKLTFGHLMSINNLIWFLLQIVIEGKKIFSKFSVEDSKVTTV